MYPLFAAATSGTYFTLAPVKVGFAPVASLVILKVSAGSFDRGLRGSLRSLRVSSPVFVRVAVTLRFSTVLTDSGPKRAIRDVASCNRDIYTTYQTPSN